VQDSCWLKLTELPDPYPRVCKGFRTNCLRLFRAN